MLQPGAACQVILRGLWTAVVQIKWRGALPNGWISRSLRATPVDDNLPGIMNKESRYRSVDFFLSVDTRGLPDVVRGRGGGGFFMPRRNNSPVSLRFQFTEMRWLVGCRRMMDLDCEHSSTQPPQYQHSSG